MWCLGDCGCDCFGSTAFGRVLWCVPLTLRVSFSIYPSRSFACACAHALSFSSLDVPLGLCFGVRGVSPLAVTARRSGACTQVQVPRMALRPMRAHSLFIMSRWNMRFGRALGAILPSDQFRGRDERHRARRGPILFGETGAASQLRAPTYTGKRCERLIQDDPAPIFASFRRKAITR